MSLGWKEIKGVDGTLEIGYGDPNSGPGSGPKDGGIVVQKPHGDQQVCAHQLHPTDGILPIWGPITETVYHIQADGNGTGRLSVTAMGQYADPNQGDVADDYRIQRESFGNAIKKDLKITLQNEDGYHVEQFNGRADGNIQFFRRTDSPAPYGEDLEFIIGQEKRGPGNVHTTPGQKNSPKLVLRGTSFDSSQHNSDWGLFTEVGSNSGNGNLVFEKRTDSNPWNKKAVLTDSGIFSATNLTLSNTLDIGAGSNNVLAGKNDSVFASSVPADTALLGVKNKNSGNAAWYGKGEDGFAGFVLLVNDIVTGSDSNKYMVVQGTSGETLFVPCFTSLP